MTEPRGGWPPPPPGSWVPPSNSSEVPGVYSQPGQQARSGQSGQPDQYGQRGQYGQPDQYGQRGQYGQAASYGQYQPPGRYGQGGPYTTQGQYGSPQGQYPSPQGQYSSTQGQYSSTQGQYGQYPPPSPYSRPQQAPQQPQFWSDQYPTAPYLPSRQAGGGRTGRGTSAGAIVINTLALVLVVSLAVVGWSWLKRDLATSFGPVTVQTPQGPATKPPPTTAPPSGAPTTPGASPTRTTSVVPSGQGTTKPTTAPRTTNSPPPGVPRVDWGPLPGSTKTGSDWVTVQRNRLYSQKIATAACPRLPDPIPSGAAYRTLVGGLVDCEYKRWLPALTAIGVTYSKPRVVFFSGSATSECGSVTAQEVSFYCPSRTRPTIYVHTNLSQQSNQWWRLRLPETISHEFFHHVQASAGILQSEYMLVRGGMDDDEGTRRIELQTLCITSRILATTPAWGFTSRDYSLMVRWFRQGEQDSDHGDAESNDYWGRRGFSMVNVGGCNTWTVPAAKVS